MGHRRVSYAVETDCFTARQFPRRGLGLAAYTVDKTPVRGPADPIWLSYRKDVPLTGREPTLHAIRALLRSGRNGPQRIVVRGARISGRTRLLQEVARSIVEQPAPAPLWVVPCTDPNKDEYEPIRRALRGVFDQCTRSEIERALRTAISESDLEVTAMSLWLMGSETEHHFMRPSIPRLRRLLSRVAGGNPVLVDDFDLLPAASRAFFLSEPADPRDAVRLLLTVDSLAEPMGGEVVHVEALTTAQVELMLKRWLRDSTTAKRLAQPMTDACGGRAGAIVESVRALGLNGYLVRDGHHISLHSMPSEVPVPASSEGDFASWVCTSGGPGASVLNMACLMAGPDDANVLAEAAGVKQSFVSKLMKEVVAARGGRVQDRVFASQFTRESYRRELSSAHMQRAVSRYCGAWREIEPTFAQGIRAYVERVHAAVLGDDEVLLRQAMRGALAAFSDPWDYPGWCLDVISMAGISLAQSEPQPTALLVDIVRFLRRADRLADASQVATLTVVRARNIGPGLWFLKALLLCEQSKHGHARAMLQQRLSEFTADGPDPHAFEAFALLADLRFDAHDVEGARGAWRVARGVVADDDLYALARWHMSLAACATSEARTGCSVAHLRRAGALLLTHGDLVAAADVHERWGVQEVRRGKLHSGLDALSRAAQLYHLLQDSRGEAGSRYIMGQTHARCESYDAAVEHLERAADVAVHAELRELLVEVHLALALAHRGRGDLAQERHFAALAAEAAGGAMARVRAAAILAEADLRAGSPGAEPLLERSERDLRAAGLLREANAAQLALFDSFLRAGDRRRAEAVLRSDVHAPLSRLAAARLALASGLESRARELFAEIGRDMSLPADVRAGAYAYLAEACCLSGRDKEALTAAKAGSALLEVTHRSRADDSRIHRMLAVVFAHVGELGRSVGHRSKAKRRMAAMAAGTTGASERFRMMRAHWQSDPRPETVHSG